MFNFFLDERAFFWKPGKVFVFFQNFLKHIPFCLLVELDVKSYEFDEGKEERIFKLRRNLSKLSRVIFAELLDDHKVLQINFLSFFGSLWACV